MLATRQGPAEAAGTPAVSVIIPHYNDLDALRVCLRHLQAQTFPADDFEIVVADNNSACGIEAVRAAAQGARVVPAPEQGAGPARNAAVAASRGRVLAFIDSDCIPDPAWIAQGTAALARHDIVGGEVITIAQDPARPNPVEAFEVVFNFDFRRYIEKVGFSGTGNLFVPRAVFDRVGGFLSGVSEDMEWCFRARAQGLRIGYAEAALVHHPARRDWQALYLRWQRLVSEHYQLACTQPGGRLRFAAKALAMPLSVVPHVGRILASPRLPDARARAGAVLMLARLRLWRTAAMLRLAARGHG